VELYSLGVRTTSRRASRSGRSMNRLPEAVRNLVFSWLPIECRARASPACATFAAAAARADHQQEAMPLCIDTQLTGMEDHLRTGVPLHPRFFQRFERYATPRALSTVRVDGLLFWSRFGRPYDNSGWRGRAGPGKALSRIPAMLLVNPSLIGLISLRMRR